MKCPNCDKTMMKRTRTTKERFYHWEDEEFYYRDISCEKYTCKACGIVFENDKWCIPDNLLPTERQKNTILYINNHLDMNLEALTKHQCWLAIGKYFDEAKNTPLRSSEDYEELQEWGGICEGDFF